MTLTDSLRPRFAGTYTALVTPFQDDESVDTGALRALLEEQIEAGVDAVVMLGTTGEAPTISGAEARHILAIAVEAGKGRLKVIAGVGCNDTKSTEKRAREARDLGVDALLVVSPYYNKPTQEGLFRHFSLIADSVDLPQIVYNIRGRTAVNVETSTLVRLAQHPRIVGVKEASGDIPQMMDVISRVPADFAVLSGDDALTLPLLALGGHGVISVLSNLVPKEVKQLVELGLWGEINLARALHYELLPLMQGCFLETNPIPIKTALAIQGKVEEVFRLPMCPMQQQNRKNWKALLFEHGLLRRRAAEGPPTYVNTREAVTV
jgi:4-hydroxy-tetrahydrodipicolinate synthase